MKTSSTMLTISTNHSETLTHLCSWICKFVPIFPMFCRHLLWTIYQNSVSLDLLPGANVMSLFFSQPLPIPSKPCYWYISVKGVYLSNVEWVLLLKQILTKEWKQVISILYSTLGSVLDLTYGYVYT